MTDVSSARIVVLAVPWPRVPAAVRGLEWNGQIVIDARNDFDGTDLDGTTSSELIAALVPGARLVKAANTLRAEMLASDPNETGGRRVMFVSGDDGEARMQVATLFEDAGFSAIDLGGLATGGALQQVGGALSGANLIRLPAKTDRARRSLPATMHAMGEGTERVSVPGGSGARPLGSRISRPSVRSPSSSCSSIWSSWS